MPSNDKSNMDSTMAEKHEFEHYGRFSQEHEVQTVEIRLLLEGIYDVYGIDFRDYAPASMRRRIMHMVENEGLSSVSAMQERVLHDPLSMEKFLYALTVNTTAMFRDPTFFMSMRNNLVPVLKTYPFVRIWLAGCSTGEEAYSMAILLQEEGLYDRCRVYATDMSGNVLKRAKDGIFPLTNMREYSKNYLSAGGHHSLSQYYTAMYDHVIFDQSLKRNLIFAKHNLVSDHSFNEFNLILCRNVMIYFNRDLQEKVFRLLHESLSMFGVLALGAKESIRFHPFVNVYEEIDIKEKIYKRVA